MRFGADRSAMWIMLAFALCGAWAQDARAQTPVAVTRRADGSYEFYDGRTTPAMPTLLTVRQQYELRLQWLAQKHAQLLPMMRRHGIDMWIIVNHEFYNDPVTQYVAPDLEYPQRRSVKVFVDGGARGLLAYSDYWRPTSDYARFFQPLPAPTAAGAAQNAAAGLRELMVRHDPGTIGLNADLGDDCLKRWQGACARGQSSGLTYDAYHFLVAALGAEAERRFVSAAALIEEYFDTRLPDELDHNRDLFVVTDILAQRALSNEVITPGVTTAVDVKWWFVNEVARLGVGAEPWFEVHTAVQRFDPSTGRMIPYVHPAPDEYVFQRGDIIHMDLGFDYMGFASDWQKVAYILRADETDVPDGLKVALRNANRIHEAFASAPRPRMSGWEATIAVARQLAGVEFVPNIYSHPIGYQGHGLGPGINARVAGGSTATGTGPAPRASRIDLSSPPTRDSVLRPGSYRSIEFSASSAIPEYNGGMVSIAMEDGAYLTASGYRYFSPYQTQWYLIR
jgi:Xaa-Pro aminopeptidase